jgi:hypothetical protein
MNTKGLYYGSCAHHPIRNHKLRWFICESMHAKVNRARWHWGPSACIFPNLVELNVHDDAEWGASV